jgi:6-phosphogluconolactonase
MKGELAPRQAAKEYEQILKRFFNGTPSFDLIFLGLGADGHTASLFPNTKALHEKKRIAVPNVAKGTSCLHRVTLTFPVINSAKTVCFLVSGKEKAKVFQDILKRRKKYPAGYVNPKRGDLIWMIDALVRRG